MSFQTSISPLEDGKYQAKVKDTVSGLAVLLVLDSEEKAKAAIEPAKVTVQKMVEANKYTEGLKVLNVKRIKLPWISIHVTYGEQVEDEYHVYFTNHSFEIHMKKLFAGLSLHRLKK